MEQQTLRLENDSIELMNGDVYDISTEYDMPAPQPTGSFVALKDRIKYHYELCSDYYYSLW